MNLSPEKKIAGVLAPVFALRGEDDFLRHLDYIHFNPVKHGHAVRVQDWPYSSFRRWVRFGAYPIDWAGVADDEIAQSGER